MLELAKFNGFFKNDFDVFLVKDIYGINYVNNKLENFTKILYKKHPDLKKVIPNWKMAKIGSMESANIFMWSSNKKHYEIPHFFMRLNFNDFYIHTCFEAVGISRKFVKALKHDLTKRTQFINILRNSAGFMIEIDKVDFMRIGSPKNQYTTLTHIWLNRGWDIRNITEFINTQMNNINNLPRGKFITKKACFYLRKYIYRDNPILETPNLVDEVYQTIQKLLPMYNFLLTI